MTTSPLRELAAEMRECEKFDWNAGEFIWRERASYWASFLESLAGEYAVVPRVPTETMVTLGRQELVLAMDTCDFAVCARYTYRAMIEAAERQETGR